MTARRPGNKPILAKIVLSWSMTLGGNPDRLVPPQNLAWEDFVFGSPTGLFSTLKKSGVKISARALAMARLCVEVYKEMKKIDREYKLAVSPEAEKKTWAEYALHWVVVCPVTITPVGSEGMWMVNLRTTHVNHPTHPGILRTVFLFSEGVSDLSKPSKSLKFDWVIAVKDAAYVIIGSREKIAGTEKEIKSRFEGEGYMDLGVISVAEEDRRMGFVVK